MSEPDIFLPLLFKVRRFPYDPTATNDLGNEVEQWGDAEELDVYGWGAPASGEKMVLDGDTRVTIHVELMVPPGFKSRSKDRFELGSTAEVEANPGDFEKFRQVGPLEDYEHNPFGWNPGSVVNLTAVSGGQ